MLVYEYRIHLPLTQLEYKIGYIYSVMKTSASETGGGEGIQMLESKPCFEGRYRKNAYFLREKAPPITRHFIPGGEKFLHLVEESWSTHPTGEAVLTTPTFMKDKFYIKIQTLVQEEKKAEENVFKLRGDDLKRRVVKDLDIADISQVRPEDYSREEDPSLFRSEGRGKGRHHRGPLQSGWLEAQMDHHVLVYKLVTCHFQRADVQARVESKVQECAARVLNVLHRRTFCWMDEWADLTHPELIIIEKELKKEIEKFMTTKPVRGTFL